jgi:FAD/FMN-containing dehydrogenase
MIRHADVSLPNHDERVEALVQRVRELAVTGQTAHIDTGGVHQFATRPGDARSRSRTLDTSALCHVLEIDPEGRRCIAEPNVRFRDLVRATLPHGLVPTVVPGLAGITLGGAVAGHAAQSTSFRHGGFFDSVEALELVTGTGELLTLSPTSDPAAFPMLHGSTGPSASSPASPSAWSPRSPSSASATSATATSPTSTPPCAPAATPATSTSSTASSTPPTT